MSDLWTNLDSKKNTVQSIAERVAMLPKGLRGKARFIGQ